MLIYNLTIKDTQTGEILEDGVYFLDRDIKSFNLKHAKSKSDMNNLISVYDKKNLNGDGRYLISIKESDK